MPFNPVNPFNIAFKCVRKLNVSDLVINEPPSEFLDCACKFRQTKTNMLNKMRNKVRAEILLTKSDPNSKWSLVCLFC